MGYYCKAYKLQDLRQFSGWTESPAAEGEGALSDQDICYIWDDFTVVRSPIQNKDVLFTAVTPEWRQFCQTVLHFEIPAYLTAMNEQVGT